MAKKPKRHFVEGAVGYDPDWKAKRAAMQKKRKAAKRAAAKTVRKGTQAKRNASRSPGGYQAGGNFDVTDYNPDRKFQGQKQLETAKTVRKGKQAKRKASRSPGGYQSGRTVNPRAVAKAAIRRNASPLLQGRPRFEGTGSAYDRLSGKGGGWAAGSTVETYNDQVKRKYGGGKL